MNKNIVSILLLFSFFLFQGCFDSENGVIDRVSTVTNEEYGILQINIPKDQLDSGLSSKIAAPFYLDLLITVTPADPSVEPKVFDPAKTNLSELYNTAKDIYQKTLDNIPKGELNIKALITDSENHPLLKWEYTVTIIPGTVNPVEASFLSSDVPTLVNKPLAKYFPFIDGRQLKYSFDETLTVYDQDYNVLSVAVTSGGYDLYNTVIGPAPNPLFGGQLPGSTLALAHEAPEIEEFHFRWTNGNLYYCGERERLTGVDFVVSNNGNPMTFSNITIDKVLTLSANSIDNTPLLPKDFKLGQRYTSVVNGQMKFSAITPAPSVIAYFFHPIEVVTNVDFVDMVDVGPIKDVLRFIMSRKVFDRDGGGKRLIREDVSEVYYALGIGKIKQIGYNYVYHYDTVTDDLFRIEHEEFDIKFVPPPY